jgi:hypothetical protein
MQEQLAKNRELTLKLWVVSESEEEDGCTESGRVPVSNGMGDLQMNCRWYKSLYA